MMDSIIGTVDSILLTALGAVATEGVGPEANAVSTAVLVAVLVYRVTAESAIASHDGTLMAQNICRILFLRTRRSRGRKKIVK